MRERLFWTGLLLMGFFAWLKTHDSQVKAEARLEQTTKVVKTALDSIGHLNRRIRVSDSAYNKVKDTLNRERRLSRTIDSTTKVRVDSAVTDLRRSLDTEQQARLDVVVMGYEQRLKAKDAEIAATGRLLAIANQQIAERDSVIYDLTNLSKDIGNAFDEAKQVGSPGLIKRIGQVLPFFVAGYFIREAMQ